MASINTADLAGIRWCERDGCTNECGDSLVHIVHDELGWPTWFCSTDCRDLYEVREALERPALVSRWMKNPAPSNMVFTDDEGRDYPAEAAGE